MKLSFVVCLALLACLASGPALAKKQAIPNIDFGRYTCQEFIDEIAGASAEDTGAVLMWLDGYLSGISGDTELKWTELEQFGEGLINYCSRNKDAKMLDAAKQVGIQE